MRRRLRQLIDRGEEGFSLIWIAMVLTLLLGMAAFGTDLGWLYLNAVRAQNAVDAAVLAGVVNLPGFSPQEDAYNAARANGYDPGGADDLVLTPTADNQLYGKLTTNVQPFFLRVLGFDNFTISRESTAQYIKPVPLGSPTNCFGGGSLAECPGTGAEDFWAAASGRNSRLEDGDPYSTLCDLNNASGCSSSNGAYARGGAYPGYYYGIDVPSGQTSLQVHIWNGAWQPGGSGAAGDANFSGPNGAVTSEYTLYRPDTTPLIPQDHLDGTSTPVCSSNGSNGWAQLCSTISDPTPGIWLVHVETVANPAGSNNFAIRAEGSPTTPRVYGINDMSIWSDDLVQDSELYLAEVTEEHAGKKLELAFYDAGDAFDQSFYSVLKPDGSVAQCTWRVYTAQYPDDSATEVTSLSSGSTPQTCRWETQVASPTGAAGRYNKLWIVALIDLPEDPADMCDGSDCWWKMDLDLANPTERTTWRARVIGNPVRLVPVTTTTSP
jgi:hypothetical protein